METPPDLSDLFAWAIIISTGTFLLLVAFVSYWCERAMRMNRHLVDTIRTMGLAASNPVLAAKLEQQRLRQQPPSFSDHSKTQNTRAAMLSEIAAHQGAKARERHAQNRAAHPTPAKPATMRYIAPDADLLPPDDKPAPTTTGAPQ